MTNPHETMGESSAEQVSGFPGGWIKGLNGRDTI